MGNKINPTTDGNLLEWVGVLIIKPHVDFGTNDLMWNT